jgi:acyl-CoA reductase-like NAD-dependent aldehyde dehydrogenase
VIFAVGLSRQLYGLTIASERPKHRLMEQWHPLGVVGVITGVQLSRRCMGLEQRAGASMR